MQAAKPARENPLDLVPIAPHLRGSAVLKMLHEDDPGHMAAASWQMEQSMDGHGGAVASRPLYFMARASKGHIDSGEGSWVAHDDNKGPSKGIRSRANWPVARRQVCWPPNPEYVEVPLAPETNQVPNNQVPTNQVPTNQVPTNQVSANHISVNQAPPLLNHAPNNQVEVNRALVNQAPDPRSPEIPAAPVLVHQNEAPSLPPTGAKVPPPVPPRPANYPQVSMEVQQQALQQVSEQMHQQSVMNSSTSSRQEPQDVTDDPVPNMTSQTQFPAGFKMRDQAPVQQTPPAMILSQPAFKITEPLKQKGDKKWPPKGDNLTQEQVREFTKPTGGKRDYTEFFAQNALPQTFNCYRPPPGTQHRGEVSEM